MDVCRVCRSKRVQMISLHEKFSLDNPISIFNALEDVMALKLNKSNGCSQVICNVCISSLKITYDLKTKLVKTENSVTNILNGIEQIPEIKVKKDPIIIKKEKGEISDVPDDINDHVSNEKTGARNLNPKHRKTAITIAGKPVLDDNKFELPTIYQEMYELPDVCRICRGTSGAGTMLSIHEKLFGPDNPISIFTALENVMGLKLHESKLYSQEICNVCVSSLKIAYDLKAQLVESEKVATSLLNNNDTPQLPEKIQGEYESFTSSSEAIASEEDQSMTSVEKMHDKGGSSGTGSKPKIAKVSGKLDDAISAKTLKRNLCDEKPPEFICASCSKSFATKCSLIKHIKDHEKKKNHAKLKFCYCAHCSYKTTDFFSLESHMLKHRLHACKSCHYKTRDASVLKAHILTHAKKNPYACQECNYKCSKESHLKIHVLTHTGEKPYICRICDYKCTRKDCLKRHLLTHTGQKPFACQHCDYKCTAAGNLKRHMLTHTGEKPYTCWYCDYKCRQAINLKKHMLTHSSEKPNVHTKK